MLLFVYCAQPGPPYAITIVVPCYNEEQVIGECAARLRDLVGSLVESGKLSPDSRILFVNDGSRDRTWQIIERLCGESPLFAGMSLSRNFGHQFALLAGLHAAPGDAAITVDADLQDDLGAIEQMVDRFGEGYHIVYGVRCQREVDSLFKKWTALSFYRIMSAFGARTIYNHADFRLMGRPALEALRDYRETNLFLRGVVVLLGFPSATVTYDRVRRFAGETKYSFGKMLALSISAVTAFSNAPLRMITLAALTGTLALAGMLSWVLWARLFTNRTVPGWTSVLLPTLFIGFLNLLAIGIVGEYLARIFDEVKSRPRYIVAVTRNLDRE
jgi:polyisoprenyl-phosphate glycosyltransferase